MRAHADGASAADALEAAIALPQWAHVDADTDPETVRLAGRPAVAHRGRIRFDDQEPTPTPCGGAAADAT